jgi:DNA-binding ferritin-like protein
MELTTIPETDVASSCESMNADLLTATEAIIVTVNRAFAIANEVNEQGIADFLASRDDMHKKWAWQLRASMKD